MWRGLQYFSYSSFMVFTWEVVKRFKHYSQPTVTFENLRNLYSLRQPNTLQLKVEVLIEIERRVVDKMKPKITGVTFPTELQAVVAYHFMVDVYLDEGLLILGHQL